MTNLGAHDTGKSSGPHLHFEAAFGGVDAALIAAAKAEALIDAADNIDLPTLDEAGLHMSSARSNAEAAAEVWLRQRAEEVCPDD